MYESTGKQRKRTRPLQAAVEAKCQTGWCQSVGARFSVLGQQADCCPCVVNGENHRVSFFWCAVWWRVHDSANRRSGRGRFTPEVEVKVAQQPEEIRAELPQLGGVRRVLRSHVDVLRNPCGSTGSAPQADGAVEPKEILDLRPGTLRHKTRTKHTLSPWSFP